MVLPLEQAVRGICQKIEYPAALIPDEQGRRVCGVAQECFWTERYLWLIDVAE